MSGIYVHLALEDLREGMKQCSLAFYLARDDIRQRYARTMLGPLWLIAGTGIWLGAMGLVMASLFNQDLHEYFPFLCVSMLVWMLIANALVEGCQVLLQASALIYHYTLPISLHYLRYAIRTLLILLHYTLLLALLFLFLPAAHPPDTAALIAGVILIITFLSGVTFCLSLLNLRFRDVQMAVATVVQVLPFVTPVVWSKEMLHSRHWLADINPFYHLLQIVRAPLLGEPASPLSWAVASCMAGSSLAVGVCAYLRYRHRIVYWL